MKDAASTHRTQDDRQGAFQNLAARMHIPTDKMRLVFVNGLFGRVFRKMSGIKRGK